METIVFFFFWGHLDLKVKMSPPRAVKEMPGSTYPGHSLLGEGSKSSSSENTGSQIQYDRRSWLNIHTKTHHLLYLGLPFIFNSTYTNGALNYPQTTDQNT